MEQQDLTLRGTIASSIGGVDPNVKTLLWSISTPALFTLLLPLQSAMISNAIVR